MSGMVLSRREESDGVTCVFASPSASPREVGPVSALRGPAVQTVDPRGDGVEGGAVHLCSSVSVSCTGPVAQLACSRVYGMSGGDVTPRAVCAQKSEHPPVRPGP